MNVTCEQMDDLLFDGSEAAMDAAARHAAGCPPCAAGLAAWNDLSATAASMRQETKSDLLWPRIERSLKAERRGRIVRRLAAAAALVFALTGPIVFAVRTQAERAAFDRDILRVSALDEVERAERAHLAAIDRLENVAGPKLGEASTPLMVSYKEKLMLLDDAIAECEANIDRNRQNAHLRRQLLAMYSEKQQTLQDVLREENNVH